MGHVVVSVAERPDLVPLLDGFDSAWPEFMRHDPLSGLLYGHVADWLAEYCLVALDGDEPVARAYSAPWYWAEDPARHLPAGGYDAVLLQAVDDSLAGRAPNLVSALEITVRPERRGAGLSRLMLDALRDNTARLGYRSLVAPVRPTAKHDHADLSMAQYVDLRRLDGLAPDPWLRTHQRAGGRVVGVAARSMTIVAELADWRRWTGQPFTDSGPVRVPGGLVPVMCDVQVGWGVYVEPNVWVHHDLRPTAG